ncbi:hypothetical protein N7478_004134 [Penicillium angulare]|uniref:uncharacterized protein n=1 Tax=Penicillium angulare TaxID=116970 RepID=UPI00254172B5|nr:uncharacterized protein N7478_004134 [Penicillium angulare]KAJ5278762.1 hypothetical protein N7478_004134 [Penicillium angulare]
MGGAPLRSKGCNTCRKRKVKQAVRHQSLTRPSAIFNGPNAPVVSEEATTARDTKERAGVINVNSQIRSQLFSLFIDSYIPSPPVGHINLRCQKVTNVIEDFPSLMDGKNSQLFDRAISALAAAFVGKKFNDSRLTHHGVKLYNHAIQAFAALIPRTGLPVQEVLCANVVFQLYEVINCTYGFAGWMAHMQGANAVLALHEKSLKRDQLSTMLLRQLKLSNIFHAIGKSQSALSSFPMWKMLSPPRVDDPLDEIIDILMECTALLEKAGSVQTTQDLTNTKYLCHELEWQAHSWHTRLTNVSECPLYTLVPDDSGIPRPKTRNAVFPERFDFISVDIAEAYMLYWTALLVISSVLYEFECQTILHQGVIVSSHHVADSQNEYTSFFHEALFYADQLCRGVGYFIQPHMHILGGHNLLFPVAMSSQFFHRNGFYDRYDWCQDVFATLESMGLGLASVLQGTPWLTYKSGESENSPC